MKKNYLIGNAHIDPVWQWQWQDGFSEILATFQSVLDRMDEFADFKFTSACAEYYEWVEKTDPAMFERIKQRVKEGRWCIAGGWFIQPDCNLPCGEAFVRQALFSQNYFLEKFGIIAKTGYNVDSFGHNGGLPQILKKSGLENYVFMRPDKNAKKLPANLFKWRGADGSEVLTYRIPHSYCNKTAEDVEKTRLECEGETFSQMIFYGVGNHGGGPTIRLLNDLKQLINNDGSYFFSHVDGYFADADGDKNIETVEGDMQYHAKGCYSVHTGIKSMNRRSENSLLSAEIFSVVAAGLTKRKYRHEKLQKAWKNLMFCQFHDTLGGCVIKPVMEDSAFLHGEIMSIANQETFFAQQQIAWNIDTLKGNKPDIFRTDTFYPYTHEKLGSPVVLFNPLPWTVKTAVRIYPKALRAEDEDGKELLSQVIRGFHADGKQNIYNTLIYTDIPAFGYKVVRIFKDAKKEEKSPFLYGENFIENEKLRVTFDKSSGGIFSIFDKTSKRELMSGAAKSVLADETHEDTWTHFSKSFDKLCGEFLSAEMHVTECGGVRVVMRVITRCGNSEIRQDYALLSESNEVRVEVRADFHEKHKMLRFAFPVNVKNPRLITENAYGTIENPVNNEEFPCGKWFAVTDGANGLCVANDSKYSYSADGSTAYMTVMRGAIYCDHFGVRDEFCEYIDQGIHEFKYSIFPFISLEDAQRKAYELNFNANAIIETFHNGNLPSLYEGIKVSAQNIIVTAFKKAHSGSGYILRAYECAGRNTETEIQLTSPCVKIKTTFSHNEIKTFRINGGKVSETDLIERDI